MIFLQQVALALGASLIDRFLGDPEKLPHPVRYFGKLISLADTYLNKGSRYLEFIWGFVFAIGLMVAVYALAYFSLAYLKEVLPSWLYWSFLLFLANQCVSYSDLKREAIIIFKYLSTNNLPEARNRLKRIVGRDTDELKADMVTLATVESVAESTPDGILAPLFYMCLGGVPAALAMKAVNTMDSMIGHRDEKYEYFGKTAARLDDILGFLPARLTVLLFGVAAALLRERSRAGFILAVKQGHRHASLNAGYSEASMAGSLGVCLGGKVSYEGEEYERPVFDGGDAPLSEECIVRALKISALSQWLFLLLATVLVCLWIR